MKCSLSELADNVEQVNYFSKFDQSDISCMSFISKKDVLRKYLGNNQFEAEVDYKVKWGFINRE